MDFIEEVVDSDFEEFLDEKYEKESANGIQNEDSANYYIGRIKRNRDFIKMTEDKAKSLKDSFALKVDLWKTKKVNSLKNDIEHCMGLLSEYFERVAKDENVKLRFPEGNLGFYKTRESVKVDEKEVFDFIQKYNLNNGGFERFIMTVPTLDKKTLKEEGHYDPESMSFKIDEIIIPGVTVTPSTKKLNVR